MKRGRLGELIYELAQNAEGGVIVEHGSYHGAGTIALCQGAKDGKGAKVVTIDDFKKRNGCLGGHYGPEDEQIWYDAMIEANCKAIQIKIEIHLASLVWDLPIAFLYWDIGRSDLFYRDWTDWNQFIIVGGIFFVKDTPKNDFKTFDLVDEIAEYSDWNLDLQEDGVSLLRKVA